MSGPARNGAKSRSRVARNWRTLAGSVLVAIVLLSALFGPAILPNDPLKPDFLATLAAPSGRFWLGTDELGRDLLARLTTGARVSLLVGSLSVGLAFLIGTTIGLLAGYGGPLGDMLLMRAMDVLFAFPSILLALAITAVLGPSLGNVIIAIAVVYTPVFARLARAQVLVVRELAYVEAARAMGFRRGQILSGTILPNVAGPLIVQGSLLFASAIITETYLSFLGLGVQPPQPSWGSMLRDAIGFMEIAPWMAWYPGMAIFIAVLGFNLLGDGLLDRFDPRRA